MPWAESAALAVASASAANLDQQCFPIRQFFVRACVPCSASALVLQMVFFGVSGWVCIEMQVQLAHDSQTNTMRTRRLQTKSSPEAQAYKTRRDVARQHSNLNHLERSESRPTARRWGTPPDAQLLHRCQQPSARTQGRSGRARDIEKLNVALAHAQLLHEAPLHRQALAEGGGAGANRQPRVLPRLQRRAACSHATFWIILHCFSVSWQQASHGST